MYISAGRFGNRGRESNDPMSHTLIYYHRLELPSESGQTIQVLRDYHAMAELGETVHLFYRGGMTLADAAMATALKEYGLAPHPRLSFHWIAEGVSGKRRLRQAAEAIIQATPDLPVVLLCRTLDHAADALAMRRKTKTRPVKVILELHETAIPSMVYRDQGRVLRAWLSRMQERAVFKRVNGIVSTVGSQLTLLDRLYPEHARAVVLPNAVAAGSFGIRNPHGRSGEKGRIHLRYAGQLSAWKNTDIMIESLKHLPERIVLDIAGGKAGREDVTQKSLLEHAARFGVRDRVNYVGFISPVAIPGFLAGADVLLLPLGDNVQSRYFTSPMKLFEYAASGVPMVAARQPTTLSLIEDGSQVLMAEPGSAESMADAVNRLIADPDLGRKLAAAAKSWVAQYTYDKRAARFKAFLNSLRSSTRFHTVITRI